MTLFNFLSLDTEDIVQAPYIQYGQLNRPSSITCHSSLDSHEYSIVTTWFRGQGESKISLGVESSQLLFESTRHSDAGNYTCQVYLSAIDIKIERTVEFVVTGNLMHAFLPAVV